jgi:hypothetical protein
MYNKIFEERGHNEEGVREIQQPVLTRASKTRIGRWFSQRTHHTVATIAILTPASSGYNLKNIMHWTATIPLSLYIRKFYERAAGRGKEEELHESYRAPEKNRPVSKRDTIHRLPTRSPRQQQSEQRGR